MSNSNETAIFNFDVLPSPGDIFPDIFAGESPDNAQPGAAEAGGTACNPTSNQPGDDSCVAPADLVNDSIAAGQCDSFWHVDPSLLAPQMAEQPCADASQPGDQQQWESKVSDYPLLTPSMTLSGAWQGGGVQPSPYNLNLNNPAMPTQPTQQMQQVAPVAFMGVPPAGSWMPNGQVAFNGLNSTADPCPSVLMNFDGLNEPCNSSRVETITIANAVRQIATDGQPYHEHRAPKHNYQVTSGRRDWAKDSEQIRELYPRFRDNVLLRWGPHGDFAYSGSTGKLETGTFERDQLEYFFKNHPRQLRLLVQRFPANSSARFEHVKETCRWRRCPIRNNTVQAGEFRVAFQEFLPEMIQGFHNPYRIAGSMHLFCFEQLFDPLEYHNSGLLVPDNHYFPLEAFNPMSLNHNDGDFVNSAYTPWFEKYAGNSSWRRPHEQSLTYALTMAHIMRAPPIRQKARTARNAQKGAEGKLVYSIDLHKGDLARYALTRQQPRGLTEGFVQWLQENGLPMPLPLVQPTEGNSARHSGAAIGRFIGHDHSSSSDASDIQEQQAGHTLPFVPTLSLPRQRKRTQGECQASGAEFSKRQKRW